MATARNPMAQKVVRLTNANSQREKAIASLVRELAELREEKAVMVNMFQEQLEEGKRRAAELKEEEVARAADLSALQQPADESAIKAEVSLLEEELQRVKLAGKRRLELKCKEVMQLRAEVEQRQAHFDRLNRASKAISTSADADLNEFESLRSRAKQLEGEIEDLESENLKMSCQVNAWGVRLGETKKMAHEANERAATQEADLCASLEAFRASADKMQKQLKEANERCEQLKQQLDTSDTAVAGVEVAKERGVQTRYLNEQTRLREQVERLTQELDRASRTGANEANAIGNWLSFCLRPSFDDPGAANRSRPQTPRSLRDTSTSTQRSLVV